MKPKDDEKQRAIAQATFDLVARTGLSGLTMAEIARAAGIATSTLYVYYPSKDELISQLYQDAKTVTASRIMQGVEPGLPYRARVRRIWSNLLRHRLDQYAEVVFQEQYYNSPWFSEGNREFSARLMAGFYALMEEGQRQEILKPVPVPLLTASLVGSVRETGNLIRSRVLPDTEAVQQMAFGLCWDALKA
ncbi:MAG: TetR/AcrR family transcriptional regulator [Acidovorax sp.]|nr:TetR/AcrR family transcriptional regulator [Acidovorax sp.]